MKEIKYEMQTLSSLILSPRSGQALYKDVDEFETASEVSNNKGKEVNCIYPFYQYGEYKKYHPKDAEYYIPGSSVKGALLKDNNRNILMADDIQVKNSDIVLRNLYKAQHIQEKATAEFSVFFENVGVEMIKAGANLQGSLYLKDDVEFSTILKSANEDTRRKMKQIQAYLQEVLKRQYSTEGFKDILRKINTGLSCVLKCDNVILLGGYKGLLHSILLDAKQEEYSNGIYIDNEKNLPHGIVCLTYKR